MPTYVYESVPSDPNQLPAQYEFQQRITDVPLTVHPQTGERLRRVIPLGTGFILGKQRQTPSATRVTRGCGCGPGCGCGR